MTPEYWHECFAYDADTGNLIWRYRPVCHFQSTGICDKWNREHANTPAGYNCKSTNGKSDYVRITMRNKGCRKNYKAHRVIWEMHNGLIPGGMSIDHANGDTWDNRLDNLRLATHSQNMQNSDRSKYNTSGRRGVVLTKSGRYAASIRVGWKDIYLGTHDTLDDASEAYNVAALKHHGEFAFKPQQHEATNP